MDNKFKHINDLAVLSVFYHHIKKHRAINKITIELGLTIDDKEMVREWLISLRERGFVYNRKGKDGALKWVISTAGADFFSQKRASYNYK